ncbi:MAG: hypothetical protein KDJ67_08855 [Nitratireductor sp.]|nr:hypothetical protein [Nitratireductor sp.]
MAKSLKANPLETVDLSQPLAGSEGVDPNHASRLRVQVLLDQHASLVQQTQFADTKAGGLVTLVGLLALKGPLPMAGMTMSDPISLAAGSFAGLCILFCMLTAFPRYPGRKVRAHLADVDRFSWPSLTSRKFSGEDYARYMHTAEVSQVVHSIALSNSAVSAILLRKFQMLRVGFMFGCGVFFAVFLRHAGLA